MHTVFEVRTSSRLGQRQVDLAPVDRLTEARTSLLRSVDAVVGVADHAIQQAQEDRLLGQCAVCA